MTRLSAKAEYRAMISIISELTWIKQVLVDSNINVNEPMKKFCDNQAARHIASNLVFHERTEHIEVDFYFNIKMCNQRRLKPRSSKVKIN
jgi:hypothetical protein